MIKTTLLTFCLIGLFACESPESNMIPDFNYKTLDGRNISRNDLKNKATVICVWATWCGDCIREIPELNELVEKYKDNSDVKFIAFSDEDETTVNKSLKRFPFSFQHIVDSKAYSDKLKTGLVKHFPQVLVIDKELNVVFEVTENKTKIFSTLDSHIQKTLK